MRRGGEFILRTALRQSYLHNTAFTGLETQQAGYKRHKMTMMIIIKVATFITEIKNTFKQNKKTLRNRRSSEDHIQRRDRVMDMTLSVLGRLKTDMQVD